MDSNFDLDVNMSEAPGHGRGRGNGSRACHTCGQEGHFARNCPQNQNQNQNLNQNRNANQQQGRNGKVNRRNGGGGNQNGQNGQNHQNHQNQQNQNGNQNRNDNGRNGGNRNEGGRVHSKDSPDDLCHVHKTANHTNKACTYTTNVHHPDHRPNGQQHQQQQGTQPRPQHNRHGNIRSNHGPLSNSEHNYCERCNTRGHTAVTCEYPRAACLLITCLWCKNKGHSHLECNHPLCCANCRGKGHSAESCHSSPSLETLMLGRFSYAPVPPFRPQPRLQVPFFTPRRQTTAYTKATFGPDFTAPAPLDELTEYLLQLKAQKESERRHAIDAKCWAAHNTYGHKLLNQEIMEGERFFSRIDPANPQIHLPKNKSPTGALTSLFANFITHRPFGVAASLVAAGWNFFRDPRALDAIAGCAVPTCNGCAKKGRIMSATFEPIPVGTDVLTVDDWDVWGVSILFGCGCCREVGYSFVQGADDQMDCS